MQQRSDLITASQYAKSRKLNKSTISRQLRDGKIPSHGGLVDPAEADAARRDNLYPLRGGKRIPAESRPADPFQPVDFGGHARQAVLAAVRRIADRRQLLHFAQVALRAGCTPSQAYALACWFPCQVSGALDELDADECDFGELAPGDWKRVLGADFDFDAGEELFERASCEPRQTVGNFNQSKG